MAGAAVLVVLAVRLGGEPFLHGLAAVGPVALATALAVGALTTLASAWRWRLVAGDLGLDVPFGAAVAAYYRSQLLNSALPGGVLGDVHRAVDRGRRSGATGTAVRSVVWDRAFGQLVQVALFVLLLRVLPLAVLTVAALGLALVRFRRVAAGVVAASLVAVAGYVVLFLVAASSTGVTASLEKLVPLGLVVLLAAAVPLNLAGWGPREGAAAWAFAAAGLGAEQGLATSVAYGVMALVAAAPGLLLLVRRTPGPEVSRA